MLINCTGIQKNTQQKGCRDMENLTFELELLSDFHVGSGHRLGTEVDSSLLRENDGLPALRGTTIAALMRDGLRRLIATPVMKQKYQRCAASGASGEDIPNYCGQKSISSEQCPICRLFGSPRQPKSWAFTSAKVAGISSAQAQKELLDPSFTGTPTMRVRVDPRIRRAADNQLFSEEVGDGRLTFRFDIDWQGEGVPDDADIALLVAAARMVRNLGASRRRGRGECRIHLTDRDSEARFLGLFTSQWLEGRTVSVAKKRSSWPKLAEIPARLIAQDKPFLVQIIARLDEPMLVAQKPEAGNEFNSLAFIPGNSLLGALAARVAKNKRLATDKHAYSEFISTFKRDRFRFGNLLPCGLSEFLETRLLTPSLPAPKDLLMCKQYPLRDNRSTGAVIHSVKGYATESSDILFCEHCYSDNGSDITLAERAEKFPLKQVEGFRLLTPYLTSSQLSRREEMHNSINATSQRANEGDLFGYVAVDAGQFFIGTIQCPSQREWEVLAKELTLNQGKSRTITVRFGKATRRGYGQATLHFEPVDTSPWFIRPLSDRIGKDLEQPVTMTLLSDSIVLDSWDRYATGFNSHWLKEQLGLGSEQEVEIIRSFSSYRELHNFNAQYGIPRDKEIAIAAGSTVGLKFKGFSSRETFLETLSIVEANGIGVRLGEGFGQVAFNHTIYEYGRQQTDLLPKRIELPKELDPYQDEATSSHIVVAEAKFWTDWHRLMVDEKRKWAACEYEEFTAVARLIRSAHHGSIQSIKQQLSALGKEENLGMVKRSFAGKKVESRDQKPFFGSTGNGSHGLSQIGSLLDELQARVGHGESAARLTSVGLGMLANRIAEAALKARER